MAWVRCRFCGDIAGRMLFSAFALAVDRFVTIGRRTAQFCFGLLMRCLFLDSPSLRPSRLLTHAKGHFVPWQGLGKRSGLSNSKSFRGDDGRTIVATCLGTPSNSIIVSRVTVGQKNLKRLVSAIETENLKDLKNVTRLCQRDWNWKFQKSQNSILRILRFLAESGRHIKLFDLFDAGFWGWKCI